MNSKPPTRVLINGFGRIGRLALRAGWNRPDLHFVGINEIKGGAKTAAHLLEFDSVQGRWTGHEISANKASLSIDGKHLTFSEAAKPAELDLSGVDVVLESTGKFRTLETLEGYFAAGAKKVIVAAPVKDSSALNVVVGVNLGDVFGLLLAWWASHLVKTRPTERRTYGLGRSSILAALANAVFLLVAIGGITWEAIRRFGDPTPVAGGTVIWVAALGIAINTATALLFMSGRKGDLNVKGAFMHMAADAAVSAGVVVAGFAILYTGWHWLDPVTSLVINAIIVWGTWALLRDSTNLALDAVPSGIDTAKVRAYLEALPSVVALHDLHIWGLSTTQTALTVHLVKPDAEIDDGLLARACRELNEKFGIAHATIQLERGDAAHPCALAPDHVV